MNRREFQIGPGAASLLLIAVVVCMGVLGALSLMSARNDARLSEREAAMAESSSALRTQAERRLAELDAVLAESAEHAEDEGSYLSAVAERLPEGMALEGNAVRWQESSEDGRRLDCAVELAEPGAWPRAKWIDHRLWTELDELGDAQNEPSFFVP